VKRHGDGGAQFQILLMFVVFERSNGDDHGQGGCYIRAGEAEFAYAPPVRDGISWCLQLVNKMVAKRLRLWS
jgi:hypothetical protein